MAKIRGPLLSLDARGKFADSIVYSNWKGIKTARTYVIPANPNTADQQTQRGYLASAVEQYRSADLTGDDKTAWDLYATTAATPMFGFNSFIKNYIDLAVAGKTYNLMFDLTGDVSTPEELTVTVEGTAVDLTLNVHYGTSPTSLIYTAAMAHDAAGKYEATIESLSTGVKYYFAVVVTLEAKAGNRTGIGVAEIT